MRKVLLLLTVVFLQACATYDFIARKPTPVPKIQLSRESRVAMSFDPVFKDSKDFVRIVTSRLPNLEPHQAVIPRGDTSPEGTILDICGGTAGADFVVALTDFEIVNRTLAYLPWGWGRYVQYSVRGHVLDGKACKVLAPIDVKGFGLNNGFNAGFDEIRFGVSRVNIDLQRNAKPAVVASIKEARDNAADDMERKILAMMGVNFKEI